MEAGEIPGIFHDMVGSGTFSICRPLPSLPPLQFARSPTSPSRSLASRLERSIDEEHRVTFVFPAAFQQQRHVEDDELGPQLAVLSKLLLQFVVH